MSDFKNKAALKRRVRNEPTLDDFTNALEVILDRGSNARKALDDIFMYAKRQRRYAIDSEVEIAWGNVIRMCKGAGCKSSILRESKRS